MPSIALRLHPDQLANPSTDLNGVLPGWISERSSGLLSDDGWGYVGELPYMVVFFHTPDLETGLACTWTRSSTTG